MKNWFIVILLMFLFTAVCCRKGTGEVTESQKPNQPRNYVKELEARLDSFAAEGYCIVCRGSDREYDTVIDHVVIKFVTDPIYDTPVDRSKHPELTNE